MKRSCAVFLLAIASWLTSCVKSFVPMVDKYENLLVVDGGITDGPGPYTIKLSKSGNVRALSLWIPFTDCKVQVKDNVGNVYDFYEKQKGVYQTDSATFKGVPGRSYQLFVSTPEGEEIESTSDQLQTGLKIQSVDAQLEHKNDPKLFYGRDGYQFYVDTETPDTRDNYLLWRLQSTYKFKTDYSILSYIDKAGNYLPMDSGDSLRTCYRTVDILNLFLLNTNDLNTLEIKHYPLYFEDNYTKALSIRYSLKVAQYKINEAAFHYWSELKKITDNGGDLYSTQPYQVGNNLKNTMQPEIPVLGYFTVAGVSEKRIFVNKPPIVFRYDVCAPGMPQMYIIEKMKNRPDLWPVYFAQTEVGLYLLDQECVNCLIKGTQEKPSFWEE
jgi:hypothetical protein